MNALTGVGILRMPGERIATPVCATLRNDVAVGTMRLEIDAEAIENTSLRGAEGDVAIRILCNA